MLDIIKNSIAATRSVIDAVYANDMLLENVRAAAIACVEAYGRGGKIMLAGNGGSAADAQHVAAELVSRFNYDRPGLNAVALTTDTSALLAIGNDYGFDRVFARQIEALGREGDIFFGISTSGNSPNILAALQAARQKNIVTIGFTGRTGGKMADLCDIVIAIPSLETPRIQECHIMLAHIICQLIEDTLFAAEFRPVSP